MVSEQEDLHGAPGREGGDDTHVLRLGRWSAALDREQVRESGDIFRTTDRPRHSSSLHEVGLVMYLAHKLMYCRQSCQSSVHTLPLIVNELGPSKATLCSMHRRSSSKKVDPPCRPTPLLQPDAIIHLLLGGYNPTLSVRTWSAAWLCAIMTVERLVELGKH